MSDVTADTPPPFERAGRDAGAVGGSDVARGSSGADGDERSARGVSGAVAPARARRPRLAGPWVKPTVFLVSLAPFVALVGALFAGTLGPNPVEALTDHTGTLAVRFLLISLALTPLRWALGDVWPVRLRRMLGLFAFFYAALHVTIYVVLDRELDLALVLEDLVERPYVMAGFAAFAVLVPLAATSTKRIARRLGRRWQSLHRWVYLAAAAAVVHYVWLAKGDLIEPYVYLVVLGGLLAWRLAKLMGTNAPARAGSERRGTSPPSGSAAREG